MTPTNRLSKRGLDHLVQVEGLRLIAYRDVAGYWTIGVGHLLTDGELESGLLRVGDAFIDWRVRGLTHDQALQLLDQDADWAERAVHQLVTVPLTSPQFDALVSFVFNVGPGAFARSTLRRQLNAGDYASVPGQLARWTFAGGRQVRGLVRRRAAEAALWREAA